MQLNNKNLKTRSQCLDVRPILISLFLEEICSKLMAEQKEDKSVHELLSQLYIKSIWKKGKLSKLHLCFHINLILSFSLRIQFLIFILSPAPLKKKLTNKQVTFQFDVIQLETTLLKHRKKIQGTDMMTSKTMLRPSPKSGSLTKGHLGKVFLFQSLANLVPSSTFCYHSPTDLGNSIYDQSLLILIC